MSLSATPAAERNQQLLACFQQALGHELPNQLVAIQGLARLVQSEAAERLSPEACDFLARVVEQSRNCHCLVQSLAEMGRLLRQHEPAAPVALADVFDEAF